MAEDFLSRVSGKASEQFKDLKSPYQLETERTKTARLRMSTYEEIKRIAFGNDEKIADVLEKAICKSLAERR